MGSLAERKIPVIYFSKENLIPGTDSWKSTCKEVRSALEQCGCFEVIYDKSYVELHNSVFAATKELFDLPTETLLQPTTNRPSLAYTPNWNYNPLFESLGIDYPSTPEGVRNFTNIMWPSGNENFRLSLLSFSKLIMELYETTTKMIFESYGVERLYKSMMAATFPRLKLAKYRAPKHNETNLGLRTHTDKTFITIVHQHEIEGLEIKTKDGQWSVDAKPSPSSFVVFAGDAFMAWSNDRVRPSEHRVVMKEPGKDRYAISLFTYMEGVIHVPEELVDDKYPLRYKPINHLNFMKRYFGDEDPALQYSPCAIKAYCGV